MKDLRKTEMEKEKRRNKNRKGPRGNVSARLQIEPTAHFPANPKRYPPLSLSPRLTGGTRTSGLGFVFLALTTPE
jgi:hypothetical protein